jgi:hypothetical protein
MSTGLMGFDPEGPDVQQEAYYTVAFPAIAADDMRWMQLFRKNHDPQYGVVDPHFTLAFGIRDLSEHEYLNHVAGVARLARQIHFTCRHAMRGLTTQTTSPMYFSFRMRAVRRFHDSTTSFTAVHSNDS